MKVKITHSCGFIGTTDLAVPLWAYQGLPLNHHCECGSDFVNLLTVEEEYPWLIRSRNLATEQSLPKAIVKIHSSKSPYGHYSRIPAHVWKFWDFDEWTYVDRATKVWAIAWLNPNQIFPFAFRTSLQRQGGGARFFVPRQYFEPNNPIKVMFCYPDYAIDLIRWKLCFYKEQVVSNIFDKCKKCRNEISRNYIKGIYNYGFGRAGDTKRVYFHLDCFQKEIGLYVPDFPREIFYLGNRTIVDKDLFMRNLDEMIRGSSVFIRTNP